MVDDLRERWDVGGHEVAQGDRPLPGRGVEQQRLLPPRERSNFPNTS